VGNPQLTSPIHNKGAIHSGTRQNKRFTIRVIKDQIRPLIQISINFKIRTLMENKGLIEVEGIL